MFNWFKKTPLKNEWDDKEIKVNDHYEPFNAHFFVNVSHNICINPESSILDHSIFKDIKYNSVTIGKNTSFGQSKYTVKDALALSREIAEKYSCGRFTHVLDQSDVNELIRKANDIAESLENIKRKYGTHEILFNNNFVKKSININSSSNICIEIQPYNVDNYINLLKENGYTKYIDDYRAYIIDCIAAKLIGYCNGGKFLHKPEYNYPSTQISFYTDWLIQKEAEIERNKKNMEYKAIIDEIIVARDKLSEKKSKK